MDFRGRLLATARRNRSWLCLGLDPDPQTLAGRDPLSFCAEMLDRVGPRVCAVKPQSAYFEALGPAGLAALRDVVADARRRGLPVILDAKRGDISDTAHAYARAAFDVLGADAVTVNAYMGRDAVDPFAARADRGVFVLCRTSNPSARDLQDAKVDDGALFERTARLVAAWDRGNLGVVAGATYPADLARVRALVGEAMPILVPGVGAQGGTPADAARGANAAGEMAVVNASRAILRAPDPAAAAETLRSGLEAALGR